MNHKKIIALTAAISMLTFSGCSPAQEPPESTDAADISVTAELTADTSAEIKAEEEAASAETTAETASETEETSAEAASESKAAPASGLSAEEAYSAKNGESWTNELMTSTSSWDKGNVVLKCSASEGEDIVTTIEMSMYNNKVYMDTQVPGIMSMTMIIDGEKGYLIDKPSKTFAIDTETEYDADSEVESIVDTTADYSSFTEDGIENIDGTDYIYEKFDSEEGTVVYYYTPDGKLSKMGTEGEMTDFTIDLLNEPDESCFVIPEDYTEISMEDMSMKMMAGLLSAMEEDSEGE